jgi:ABC-type nitrate/sulfonate/bicarbonate transport system permease component
MSLFLTWWQKIKRRLHMKSLLLFSCLSVLAFTSEVFADRSDILAAQKLAESNTQIAWIIAGAIAVAGIAIGVGLYLKKEE